MTKREILKKAIQSAIDSGWDSSSFRTCKSFYKKPHESEFLDILGEWHDISPLDVIFNHDFAKALWGEDYQNCDTTILKKVKCVAYKHHLQQMVVADDPIAYLGENI